MLNGFSSAVFVLYLLIFSSISAGVCVTYDVSHLRSVLPECGTLDVRVLGPDGTVLLSADVVAVAGRTNGKTRAPVELYDERLRLSAFYRHTPVFFIDSPVPVVTSYNDTIRNQFAPGASTSIEDYPQSASFFQGDS